MNTWRYNVFHLTITVFVDGKNGIQHRRVMETDECYVQLMAY
jgi:hypothetical protein